MIWKMLMTLPVHFKWRCILPPGAVGVLKAHKCSREFLFQSTQGVRLVLGSS